MMISIEASNPVLQPHKIGISGYREPLDISQSAYDMNDMFTRSCRRADSSGRSAKRRMNTGIEHAHSTKKYKIQVPDRSLDKLQVSSSAIG